MTTRFEISVLAVTVGLVAAGAAYSLVRPPVAATLPPRAATAVLPAGEGSGSAGATPAIVNVTVRSAGHRPASLHTVDALRDTFDRLGYRLDEIGGDGRAVPRVFLANLPRDMAAVRDTAQRKQIFFKTLLPLVLRANERILEDRKRLWDLRARIRLGEKPEATDRLWLAVMAERYGVERGDLDTLMARVDIVPSSLALAQSAEESGWGTSRFARDGNAVFGQWTYAAIGFVPRKREAGKRHRVKSFRSLSDSVDAYMRNLNTHRAYRQFRRHRATLRRSGQPLDGAALAQGLERYSERGVAYVETLRTIISANDLRRLDDARLSGAALRRRPTI